MHIREATVVLPRPEPAWSAKARPTCPRAPPPRRAVHTLTQAHLTSQPQLISCLHLEAFSSVSSHEILPPALSHLSHAFPRFPWSAPDWHPQHSYSHHHLTDKCPHQAQGPGASPGLEHGTPHVPCLSPTTWPWKCSGGGIDLNQASGACSPDAPMWLCDLISSLRPGSGHTGRPHATPSHSTQPILFPFLEAAINIVHCPNDPQRQWGKAGSLLLTQHSEFLHNKVHASRKRRGMRVITHHNLRKQRKECFLLMTAVSPASGKGNDHARVMLFPAEVALPAASVLAHPREHASPTQPASCRDQRRAQLGLGPQRTQATHMWEEPQVDLWEHGGGTQRSVAGEG